MPAPFLIIIIFPILHYAISVVFVIPKFIEWRNMNVENTSFKDFKNEVLWSNAPPHRLSVFWGSMKQVTSFLCAALAMYFLSRVKINV